MGDEPILPVIQQVTIDTRLNWKMGQYFKVKIGLNFVMCDKINDSQINEVNIFVKTAKYKNAFQ